MIRASLPIEPTRLPVPRTGKGAGFDVGSRPEGTDAWRRHEANVFACRMPGPRA